MVCSTTSFLLFLDSGREATIVFDIFGGVSSGGDEMKGLQEVTSFFMVSTGGEELRSLSPLVLQESKEYVATSDLPAEGNVGFRSPHLLMSRYPFNY